MAHLHDIHPSIVKAICAIMTSVEAVAKSNRNAHGGYNYSSTDDIYAAVTRKMGEVGLVCLVQEDLCEIKRVEATDPKTGQPKISQWARLEFSFILATEQGTWSDPKARRSLYIQVTGPQTFQSAQSYAEKAYLRSLFKLPTGDMDLDSMAQSEDEFSQVALNGKQPRKSSAEGKRDGSVKLFNEIRAEIAKAVSAEHLQHVKEIRANEWAALPRAWSDTLDEDYAVRMDDLRARAA